VEILTPNSMRKSDQDTINAGYPEILLMEAAARGTAEYADKIIKDKLLNLGNYYNISERKQKEDINILIFVGKGNNGGDGLAAARFLKNYGYQVEIILSSTISELDGINKTNFNLCDYNDINYCVYEDIPEDVLISKLKQSHFIIDALLGTGISGEVRGNSRKIIELINSSVSKSNKYILAVDIPSGINGYSGEVLGTAVKADYTSTMAAYKRGLLLFPGREYSGRVKVINIGIKESIISKNNDGLKLFTKQDAEILIPERKLDGHKGTFGKTAILSGSRGMVGAPLLSADAALRSGSGLVYLLLPEEIEESVSVQLNEVLTKAVSSSDGIINSNSLSYILDFTKDMDVLAFGPGIGCNRETEIITFELLSKLDMPLILDADALNSIKDLKNLKDSPAEILITPHPGEMSKLINKPIKEINANRIDIARNFASEYGVNIILKGAATITASPDGRAFLNNTGINGMATAGSGDVLTGITAALAAQGMDLFEAAALAVYLHGKAGEFAGARKSDFALKAGDIIDSMADAWNFIIK
jgi:NAD(P)H-hydrate epimerase